MWLLYCHLIFSFIITFLEDDHHLGKSSTWSSFSLVPQRLQVLHSIHCKNINIDISVSISNAGQEIPARDNDARKRSCSWAFSKLWSWLLINDWTNWVSSNAGLNIYLVNWRQVGWPERPHSEQPEKETLWNEISTADNCLAKINNIRPMSSSGPSPVFLLWLASPRQKSQYLVVST